MTWLTDIGEVKEISRIGEDELSVEWHIRDVLWLDGNNDEWYGSPGIRIGNEEWYLGLFPNWEREEQCQESGWMRLSACRCDEGPAQTFNVSVGIRGSRGLEMGREVEQEFLGYDDERGYSQFYWPYFCSRTELLEHRARLMPEDILVIACVIKRSSAVREADISLKSEQNVLKKGENSEVTLKEQAKDELLSSIQNLMKSEENCDVVIKVQGKEFRAHRLILQARSTVFQAMFSHDMVEKQRGIVTMEDCDQDTFLAFLEHIYTGSIGMISTGNVFSLYKSSEKYDFKTLKKACIEFMKMNLTVSSFCDTITLAVKYNEKELIEVATEFYCNNTLSIVKTADWQSFLVENPTVGNELYIKQLTK